MVDQLSIKEAILETETPNLDILPSHLDLVGSEIELINLEEREMILKGILSQIKSDYDYILIDCSPSLGLITVNALTASDSVIIPVQCEFFALEGLGKLLNTIKIVQKRLNPELNIEGLLLTMYDSRLRLSNQVVEEVRQHFDALVFETVIHRNSKISEAPSFGKPVIAFDIDSKGAANYLSLAKELIDNNEKVTATSK
jgi:chromosome partitioning protein